jgi:hypothetical protein
MNNIIFPTPPPFLDRQAEKPVELANLPSVGAGITVDEFIVSIFGDVPNDEQVLLAKQPKLNGAFINAEALMGRYWIGEQSGSAVYFNVSTVCTPAEDEPPRRRKADCCAAYCFVADDVGTKVDQEMVDPSWKLESSEDSFQFGYKLHREENLPRYEAFVKEMGKRGYTDAGAGGYNRLMRVPGSVNIKEGRGRWQSRITEWNPERVWSLDELAKAFGIDLDTLVVEAPSADARLGGATAIVSVDPMLTWLSVGGHVIKDDGGDWVDIKCPWGHEHTTGDGTAGYSPLGRGSGNWGLYRSFKCQHEHCVDRHYAEFCVWAKLLGAPSVFGYDPLPVLQLHYVYIENGQQVADLNQRPNGGIWKWEWSDWKLKYPGVVNVVGREKPVKIATAFIESGTTRKAVGTLYRPVARGHDDGLTKAHKQTYVNTYIAPNWGETSDLPNTFLGHIEYLIPDAAQRETFLNWLAYKVQNPASRSYAVIMVAEDAFGIGRSWLKDLLRRALQGHVNSASLSQLIGKGTSSEQTYNDWMAECQFLVVEEAKDAGLTRDDFYHGYETFKQIVDTRIAENVRINPKYGRTRHENIYFNVLIFTNHADAMALPEGDRRVFVVENPTVPRDSAYYDRLDKSLHGDEPARVYWWLMRHDVSGFNHVQPPMTPAKLAMIESTRAPSDQIMDWLIENHASDLVTSNDLRKAIARAAGDLGLQRIAFDSSGVYRALWRKIKTLRPTKPKHGARYMLCEKRVEVRALRNRQMWLDIDVAGDVDVVKAELAKNQKLGRVARAGGVGAVFSPPTLFPPVITC